MAAYPFLSENRRRVNNAMICCPLQAITNFRLYIKRREEIRYVLTLSYMCDNMVLNGEKICSMSKLFRASDIVGLRIDLRFNDVSRLIA